MYVNLGGSKRWNPIHRREQICSLLNQHTEKFEPRMGETRLLITQQ